MMMTREYTPEGFVYVCIYLCVHVCMCIFACVCILCMYVCTYMSLSLSLSLCWLVFNANFIQHRVTWEERILVENMPQ